MTRVTDVFVCAGCETVLTVPVARVPLPPEAHHTYGHEFMPPLMAPGTYAVDPLPSGPPYRAWEEVSEAEAAAQGVFAPVHGVSFGPRGRVVIAPGDVRGTVLVPEQCNAYCCCGIAGGPEPNMACAACLLPVGSREDDCGLWSAVWFEPHAVRRVSTGAPAPVRESERLSPIDPRGGWNPRWEAAAGAALAHLLAASGGGPLTLPGGLVTQVFGPAVKTLLPAEGPVRRVGLAGPGVQADGLDIALVPYGTPPPGDVAAVPLADGAWAWLALPGETRPIPASGTLPGGVLRDDYPLPDHPWRVLRPDRGAFLYTLARLPGVRSPWLRALYDRARTAPYGSVF
ncbi:hypothetical protein ACIRSU_13495 [Streptomyces sp. NPDC101160]|uniref:hypothetical protein n=1 Tax=Streptomyces sp. NPDC101160 TaxID=3366118 RepID=UPI0037FF5410